MVYLGHTHIVLIAAIFDIFHLSFGQPKCENQTTTDKHDFPHCSALKMGQFKCIHVEIDAETQQARGCDQTKKVKVMCHPAPDIECIPDKSVSPSGNPCTFNGSQFGFYQHVECKWTNGYSFETSLLLSIFLGMFGIDRFYLGYPAIGLLKFSTLGFFFLGQLIDILLIATQTVRPADGSDYVINYFGAGLNKIVMNNETIFKLDDL